MNRTTHSPPHCSHENIHSPLRTSMLQSIRRYLADAALHEQTNLYQLALRELEIPLFQQVLTHCNGNLSHAANLLGIHRATLRRKLKEYGIHSTN